MAAEWDARTYDESSGPQQAWAADVLGRLGGLTPDATVLDVGCGSGRVTEALVALVPRGRVLAIDASGEMVALARRRRSVRADLDPPCPPRAPARRPARRVRRRGARARAPPARLRASERFRPPRPAVAAALLRPDARDDRRDVGDGRRLVRSARGP